MSQSLSSRAMSFDSSCYILNENYSRVSIPFVQGDVFRLSVSFKFRCSLLRLNPFRAGRCLSTYGKTKFFSCLDESQSLSIRAMSFDFTIVAIMTLLAVSQSLSIRAMSFDTLLA